MASLNTLRTKFGVVLSVVICLALLAFILSLKTEMGFSGNDPKVGVIDGETITYTEYLDIYEQVKNNMGGEASNDAELDRLSNAAWQTLFSQKVLRPGFEKMGIRITDAERRAIISGETPTQALYGVFMDPRSGRFDVEAVSEFLAQAETNPQAAAMWAQLVDQARAEREVAKYLAVVKNGVYANSAEVAQGVEAANRTFSGKFVACNYASQPDSLFTVSGSEIKKYYNQHKNQYKQLPNRSISYVVFEVDPTDDDMLAIEKSVREADEEFAATTDLKGYARQNRHAQVSDRYLALKQFSDEEAEALSAGREYGPVLKNNLWTMSRVLDAKSVPDSIGVRHLAVPYTAEAVADSLATLLRSGRSFAEVSEGQGEERVYPFAAFTDEFVPALASAQTGDVVKIAAGNAIHVMQVYRVDAPSKHIRAVTVTYPVEASNATRRDIHGKAGVFAVDGAGSLEKFNEAAAAAAMTPRVATINQGDRTVRGLEDSREIVRWAADAKKGAISEIFKVGNDYVVAMLTDIDDEEYAPVAKVSDGIRRAILRDKKYDAIVSKLSGSTLDEVAAGCSSEVKEFSGLRYGAYYAPGIGFEPRVVGAIAAGEQGVLSAPVKGNTGVFVFEIEDIAVEDKQNAEAEKVRMQAMAENMAMQASFAAIQQMAEVQDLRAKYF